LVRSREAMGGGFVLGAILCKRENASADRKCDEFGSASMALNQTIRGSFGVNVTGQANSS
jgi:hypothetical protein